MKDKALSKSLTCLPRNELNRRRISQPGYFRHQFLADLLRLLRVPGWADPATVEEVKRTYFRPGELGTLDTVLPGVAAVLGR